MKTHTLTLEDGTIPYDVHGEGGQPVICSPGLGDTRATWRLLAPLLVQAGYTVYVMDLRGHGGSSTGFSEHAAHNIGDDILALIESLDLRDVVVVGNSISGGAACRVAVAAPERVASLVLVCPFVRDMPPERFMRPLVPLVFARPWGAWAWGMYRSTLFKTLPADHADNQAAVVANMGAPARLAAMRAMLRASKAPIARILGDLRVPILVLIGAQDPDYADPAAEGQALKELLGGPTRVELIGETGHYPQAERPEETAHLMLDFLAEEERRGA